MPSKRLVVALCLGGLLFALIAAVPVMRYQSAASTIRFVVSRGGACSSDGSDRLSMIPQINRLSFSGTELSGEDFRRIQSRSTLLYVQFQRCRLSETALVRFVHDATQLRHLDISESNVTNQAIESLASVSKVWSFHCNGCEMNDKVLAKWLSQNNLKYLDVGRTQISDNSTGNLVDEVGLIAICIEGSAMTGDAVKELKRQRPNIEIWTSEEMSQWRRKFAPY